MVGEQEGAGAISGSAGGGPMTSRMHRVECLDCGKVAIRLIPIDIPVYCLGCGSAALMWMPTA